MSFVASSSPEPRCDDLQTGMKMVTKNTPAWKVSRAASTSSMRHRRHISSLSTAAHRAAWHHQQPCHLYDVRRQYRSTGVYIRHVYTSTGRYQMRVYLQLTVAPTRVIDFPAHAHEARDINRLKRTSHTVMSVFSIILVKIRCFCVLPGRAEISVIAKNDAFIDQLITLHGA